MKEISYGKIIREFYTKYKSELLPVLSSLESIRKSKLAIVRSCYVVGTVATLCLCCLLFVVGYSNHIITISLLYIVLSVCIFTGYTTKKDFEESAKIQIMPTICDLFNDLHWLNGFYENDEILKETSVIPNYSSSKVDDCFIGSYKDVKFDIVESEYSIGSGKGSHFVFKGVIIKLAMNKNFISHTVIKPNTLLHLVSSSNLHRTNFEDIEFEKKYDVYTNDDVDARYLITPSFMKRLNNIKVCFKADEVSCAFYKHNLYIALATDKDLFSICSLEKPIDAEKQYFTMLDEVMSIIKLIDYFKLNQHIGL